MESSENYLRAVYELTESGDRGTTTSELADHMEVSNASVSEAVQKLEDENLLCRAPYKGFALSPMGREKAEKLHKKYEIMKDFFQDTLEVDNAEEQADAVEHSITMETAEKLEELNQN